MTVDGIKNLSSEHRVNFFRFLSIFSSFLFSSKEKPEVMVWQNVLLETYITDVDFTEILSPPPPGMKRSPYLMALRMSVAQPHLGVKPVVLGVLRRPYRVGVAGFLVQLDGNGHQVPAVSDVEQAHGCWRVAWLGVWVILAKRRNAFQYLVVHHVHTAVLRGNRDKKIIFAFRKIRLLVRLSIAKPIGLNNNSVWLSK